MLYMIYLIAVFFTACIAFFKSIIPTIECVICILTWKVFDEQGKNTIFLFTDHAPREHDTVGGTGRHRHDPHRQTKNGPHEKMLGRRDAIRLWKTNSDVRRIAAILELFQIAANAGKQINNGRCTLVRLATHVNSRPQGTWSFVLAPYVFFRRNDEDAFRVTIPHTDSLPRFTDGITSLRNIRCSV